MLSLRRLALLSLIGAMLIGAAHAAEPAGCEIHWQITPHLDATPRHLAVTMRFDGGARARSELHLPDAWAGVEDYGAQLSALRADNPEHRIEPVAGKPALRTIRHAPGDRVVLHFTVGSSAPDPDSTQQTHLDAYRALLAKDWFQFFGHGVLPTLGERDGTSRSAMCVSIDGLADGSVIATSHGLVRGAEALFRFSGGPDLARDAVYLGGRLQLRERTVEGRPLAVVLPSSVPWSFGADALADAVAQLVGTQRRFWRDSDFPFLLVALHANHLPSGSNGGTAVHQAFAMHGSDDLRVPGATFEHLVGHEHLHTWIPMRFGAMTYEGREDEALRYWFSEGFTDHYTHRLLVHAGLWSLADYAKALNDKIERYRASPARNASNARVGVDFFRDRAVGELPYQRGELLALRWHGLLRAKGHPGLDAVMRSLMLARDKARPEVPLSQPLVTHRLIAALRPVLGEIPLADINRVVEAGGDIEFDHDSLGPCFTLSRLTRPRFDLGFAPGSFKAGVLSGVVPDGPAHAAGLRDGMKLAGYSAYQGDITRDVVLQVTGDDGKPREVRYRPLSTALHEVLAYEPITGGLDNPVCKAWMGLGPDAELAPPAPKPAPERKTRPRSPRRDESR